MSFAIAIDGLEDRGREVSNMDRLSAVLLRRVEVSEGFDADYLRHRARHALWLDAEAMTEIAPSERIILVLGKRVQKSGGIRALVLLPLYLNDEVGPLPHPTKDQPQKVWGSDAITGFPAPPAEQGPGTTRVESLRSCPS
jgi:hypothetical protein